MSDRIIRVFPRKTKATPRDDLSRFDGEGRTAAPQLIDYADEVHISVTFSADKAIAERLAEQWKWVAPVKVSGPAYENEMGLDFTPGVYVRRGYTFTSRGCPRKCWFCGVWKKLPQVTPMPVLHDGWNILDDNLLAAPRAHVEKVFRMLEQYRNKRRVTFTGGLEALALQEYQVELLAAMEPKPAMFWAYDPGDEFETLERAARLMLEAGFTSASHRLRVYVMIGYPKDTFALAEKRLRDMMRIGFTPMAMLWEPSHPAEEKYRPAPEWKPFQRQWVRPAIIYARSAA